MKTRFLALLVGVLLLCGLPTLAQAQQAFVLSACGTPNTTLTAGAYATPFMDTTGNLCTNATGGGSGTSVNINQVAGASVKTGAGTASGTLRVELPTDGTGKVGLNAGSAIIGNIRIDQTTPGTTNGVTIAPTSTAGAGITPVVSASAEASHVIKASGGNLYSVYATNLTATPGFLAVVNLTSAPGDGGITPLDCVFLPANGTASINYGSGPPAVYSTGITAIVTSATTCFTKTTGVITAFIKGAAS